MPVGIIQLHLYLPLVHSLKEKRRVLKPMIHDLQTKFHVSVAEVGKQDIWQNSTLLIALASSSPIKIEQSNQRLLEFVESHWVEVYITKNQMEIIFE